MNARVPPPDEGPMRVRFVGVNVPSVLVIGYLVVTVLNLIATSCLAGAFLMHLMAGHR